MKFHLFKQKKKRNKRRRNLFELNIISYTDILTKSINLFT